MNPTTASSPARVASPEAWLAARRQLLVREKELTHLAEAVAAERRQLPWVRLDEPYVFAGPDGPETLVQLFAGRGQLLVYHFMFGPGWEEGCRSCSLLMDHVDGMRPHLAARDTTFVAVSLAPWPEIAAFQRRMGWKFKWVSAAGNRFKQDFHTSFSAEDMEAGRVNYNFQDLPAGLLPVEELPGLTAFARDEAGHVYHTYSAYARGLEALIGTYQWLDLTARGRDEAGLASTMAWVRHHDRYDADYRVDATAGYTPPRGSLFNRGCGCGDDR